MNKKKLSKSDPIKNLSICNLLDFNQKINSHNKELYFMHV